MKNLNEFINKLIEKKREDLSVLKIGDCGYQSLLNEIKKLDLTDEEFKTIQVAIDKYINVN